MLKTLNFEGIFIGRCRETYNKKNEVNSIKYHNIKSPSYKEKLYVFCDGS